MLTADDVLGRCRETWLRGHDPGEIDDLLARVRLTLENDTAGGPADLTGR